MFAGCGIEFKRRFLLLRKQLSDIVVKGLVSWPIAMATNNVPWPTLDSTMFVLQLFLYKLSSIISILEMNFNSSFLKEMCIMNDFNKSQCQHLLHQNYLVWKVLN